ncbi:M15 family metallopeptidase [Paenibacillus gansuensis]|uniref:D-alanyl-D-alanine carboxypeptidase family protein n=1 Tax=Paenibacillus gansuensis TaxID=306542 RepID=A0ABW5PE49_9BACL
MYSNKMAAAVLTLTLAAGVLAGCGKDTAAPAAGTPAGNSTSGTVETPAPDTSGNSPSSNDTGNGSTNEKPAGDQPNSGTANGQADVIPVSSSSASGLKGLRETIKVNGDGLPVVTNASSITVVVNKKRNLPATYKPADLVTPKVPFSFSGDSPKKLMRKEAAKALEQLFAAADKANIELKAVSGYRSYATQKSIFDRNAQQKGAEEANRTSAHPGQSEHQTGLAMDISSASVNYALEPTLGNTKEGKWLIKNAPKYGFIIRYMKGKESITGYSYEPWHVRYVGKPLAQDIADSGLTFEEYVNEAVPVSGSAK